MGSRILGSKIEFEYWLEGSSEQVHEKNLANGERREEHPVLSEVKDGRKKFLHLKYAAI
jgi:hypothetical protein